MTEGAPDRQSLTQRRVFLVGGDPIFQLGLQTGLASCPQIQVVGAAASPAALWSLMEAIAPPDLYILDLDRLTAQAEATVQLCYQLKMCYPNTPLLGLSQTLTADVLRQLRQIGVQGVWPKSTALEQILSMINDLDQGALVWSPSLFVLTQPPRTARGNPSPQSYLVRLKTRLRANGLFHLQTRQQAIHQWLADNSLTWWEWLVLEGQLREVKAAQRLIEGLLSETPAAATVDPPDPVPPPMSAIPRPSALTVSGAGSLVPDDAFLTMKSVLLDRLVAFLAVPPQNLTGTPFELDILRPDRKQELLLTVLKEVEDLLDELRFSQVTQAQLEAKRSQMLLDLWQNATIRFLGKYRTVSIEESGTTLAVEPVQRLLEDSPIVNAAILQHIPLFTPLLAHFLFHTELTVDQRTYPVGSSEAIQQAEALLGNLILQIANAVVQPLINHFSTVDVIRQDFFERHWLSTREIERFRNALSWKYRMQRWFVDPKDMFESRYRLILFSTAGLKYQTVYATRDRELKQLSGVPFAITFALELRDAVSPPLQSAVAFVGQGVVYVLTQVIGRSIGLIGRGVLQGVGYVRGEVRSRSQSSEGRQP